MDTFGKRLRKLRTGTKVTLTQEQLADRLGITPQAVSRWETDSALPDISMVVPLAHVFDVSTDYLLGCDAASGNERINAVLEDIFNGMSWHNENDPTLVSERIDKLRRALTAYPGNTWLSLALAQQLGMLAALRNARDRASYDEALKLCDYVCENCDDAGVKADTAELQSWIANQISDDRLLQNIVSTLPNECTTKERVLMRNAKSAHIRAENARAFLASLDFDLYQAIFSIAFDEKENGELLYTNAERIELLKKIREVYNALYERNEMTRLDPVPVCLAEKSMAFMLVKEGRGEEADEVFVRYVDDIMWLYDHRDEAAPRSLIPACADEFYSFEHRQANMLSQPKTEYMNMIMNKQVYEPLLSRPACRAAFERMENALREAGVIKGVVKSKKRNTTHG